MIILTDSTADIRGEELTKLNVEMVSLNVLIDGENYQDSKTIMPDEFYKKLQETKEFPKTSQPAPTEFEEIFEKAKTNDEELIYIGISSVLSGTFNSANIAKDLVEYDKIYLIDSTLSIQALRLLVLVACKMLDEGASALEIVDKIEQLKHHVHIYSMIDTLEYLYRGGRLSKAVATLGNLVSMKPLIDLDPTGKIRMYDHSFGTKKAIMNILKSVSKNPIDTNYPVCFGYTSDTKNLDNLMNKLMESQEITNYDVSQIGPAIGAHIGPGGFCIMYVSDIDRSKTKLQFLESIKEKLNE